MVQEEAVAAVVPGSRVARRREARREEILGATRRLAAEHGVAAVTMGALADDLDCAVGTLYTYFGSKGALIAALQADAIARLTQAYDQMAAAVEPALEALTRDQARLARLVAFGRAVIAAERRMPQEMGLQQELLAVPSGGAEASPGDLEAVVAVAFDLLARPQRLLDDAAAAGLLAPGTSLDRTVTWMAGLNGVLVLRTIGHPETGLFDTVLLAEGLTRDLLRGWGAAAADLRAAEAAVPLALVEAGLMGELHESGDEEEAR